MRLWKRRPVATPAAPTPNVFIWHDIGYDFTTTRFFFKELLHKVVVEETSTPDGWTHYTVPGVSQEVFTLQTQIIQAVPGLDVGQRADCRIYPHYIAVSWRHDDQPFDLLDEMSGPIESSVIQLLSEHFGWREPLVAQLHSLTDVRDKAVELGVDWYLGRH